MIKQLKSFVLAATVLLAGCHGSTVTETVGGTVVGLQTAGTTGNTPLQLQLNGANTITITNSGSFTFPTALDVGTTYLVSVYQQPEGETCSIANSVGILEENVGNVSSVVVTCISTVSSSDSPYGTVTGLTGTLNLTLNGIYSLQVTNPNNASVLPWAFSTALPLGSAYQVAIATQPSGQTCSITSGVASGTISDVPPPTPQFPIAIKCQ